MADTNTPIASNNQRPLPMKLSELPVWRLLVALDDAERVAGADSPTARALAAELRRRLGRAAALDKPDEASLDEAIRLLRLVAKIPRWRTTFRRQRIVCAMVFDELLAKIDQFLAKFSDEGGE